MKDYISLLNIDYDSKEELRKTFILKYEVVDGSDKEIIIYYANGEQHKTAYTKEKEKQILEKMKEQFSSYKLKISKAIEDGNIKITFQKNIRNIFITYLIVGIILLFIGIEVLGVILTIFGVSGSMFIIPSLLERKKKIKDFEKSGLFFGNEEFINQMLNSKVKDNILLNVDSKIIDQINIKETKDCTINSIDKLTLEQLKELLLVIKREYDLSEKEDDNTKGKVYEK